MTTFLTYVLAFLLIVDSLFLALLVLIQLPKKEAGVGMAFGGGAADALFGAGSGNALTKLTKYCAVAFFLLVLGLSLTENSGKSSTNPDFKRELERTATPQQPRATAPAPTTNQPTASGVPLFELTATNNSNAAPTLTTTNNPPPKAK